MARPAYSANFEVHALSEGGFRALYEIVDAAGRVVESGQAVQREATAALALSQVTSRARAAIAAMTRRGVRRSDELPIDVPVVVISTSDQVAVSPKTD